MMSMSAVSASQASSGYYKSEGYYADGSQEAKDASFWHGQGAVLAGLEGQVNDSDFDRIMEGYTPQSAASRQVLIEDESDLVYHLVVSRDREDGEPAEGLQPLQSYWLTSSGSIPAPSEIPRRPES